MRKFLIFFFVLIFIPFVLACNVGETTETQFCGVDGIWHDLLSDETACENNFECVSGNCLEGSCSATDIIEEYEEQQSLLQKIYDFLAGKECSPVGLVDEENGRFCNENSEWEDLKYGGDNCEEDYECSSGDCVNGICICETDADCPSGEVCSGEVCIPSSSGGSVSAGSGSSRSGSNSGDSYTFETIFSHILPFKLYQFSLNQLPIPITKVGFITNTELFDVRFVLKRMLTKDANIPTPEGILYQYFQLETENIEDLHLEKVEVVFRVNKEWLEDNNVNQYKIVLQRYTTKWNILKPQIIAEDDDYLYYTALTPAFSWFAITSMPTQTKLQYVPSQPVCGDNVIDTGETCESCPEDVRCLDDEICSEGRCVVKKKSYWWLIFPIIIILGGALFFFINRLKNKTIKEFKPVATQLRNLQPPKMPKNLKR